MLPVLFQATSESSQATPSPVILLALLIGLALGAMLFTGLGHVVQRAPAIRDWLRWTILRIPPPFTETPGDYSVGSRRRDNKRRREYYAKYGVMPSPTIPTEAEAAAIRAKQHQKAVQEVQGKLASVGLSQDQRYAE